jgi:sugar O-acyltransferase (sialic acid O-acetyltransferase NeuD family)
MSSLLIIGAGDHGRVVADTAETIERWSDIAFLDDRAADLSVVDGLPVLGPISALASVGAEFSEVVVAVGDNAKRMLLLQQVMSRGLTLALVVHHSAAISRRARLGPGTVVLAQCAVNAGASLGEGCIVNTGATVDHDDVIGACVHLSPGVHLGGNVRVGERTWLGIGASAKDGVSIGADVIVGAGAVVIGDIPDGVVAMGVPAVVRPDAAKAGGDGRGSIDA